VRVLVVNAGSSSLKLSVVEDERVTASTTVERWEGAGHLEPLQGFIDSLDSLSGEHDGDGRDGRRVDAVGHRVVHGGPRHRRSTRVDEELLDYLCSIEDLAPLHNPRAVAGMREVAKVVDAPAVACFDTSFHADLPVEAATYALPREWNERWALRRYGFHGLSHAHAVRRASAVVGERPQDLRIVSCHLGSGASLAAVREGRSVDTTMGFTPLEGLVMRTRAGSVDPGLVLWLLQHGGVGLEELAGVLEQDSGLRGLSGTSGDLRDVLAGRADDADARLAYAVFVHRLRREIGAMAASAGGLDLLVMTGGIGEHSPDVRADAVAGLGYLGLGLDPDANARAGGDADISAPDAVARTVVVTASEETEIARETARVLGDGPG
jgi:acetate kinase